MTNTQLLYKAFRKACKYLREHPPCDAGFNMDVIHLVVDSESDPEGERWALHFLNEVLKEEGEES